MKSMLSTSYSDLPENSIKAATWVPKGTGREQHRQRPSRAGSRNREDGTNRAAKNLELFFQTEQTY